MPYASLQPAGSTLEEYRSSLVSWAIKAKGLGFKAAKLEATLTGPYAHEVSRYSDITLQKYEVYAIRNDLVKFFKICHIFGI